ncbi:unnamed protein product [Penicillium glandicola]
MAPRKPHTPKPKTGKIPIDQLLTEAKTTDFTDSNNCEVFKNKYHVHLGDCKSGDNTILHEIVKIEDSDYFKFVKWSIRGYPELLEQKEKDTKFTPVHKAIDAGFHDFVHLVLNEMKDPTRILGLKTQLKQNCLQFAIIKRCPYTELMIEVLAMNNSPPGNQDPLVAMCEWTEEDSCKDLTPLHLALIPSENPEERTGQKGQKSSRGTDKPALLAMQQSQNIKSPSEKDDVKEPKDPKFPDPQDSKASSLPIFDSFKVMQKLIEVRPRALVDFKDTHGETPFQIRVNALSQNDADPSKIDQIIRKDELLSYTRRYIIENFTQRDAVKALYQLGEARALFFDLWGLPQTNVSLEFLRNLEGFLRFEVHLKYVALPRLSIAEDPETLQQWRESGTGKEMEGKSINDLCRVFKWLRERGVESISRINVIDNKEPSHSDGAIEDCVRGFDVREWNWYKVDLCCDVIINTSPKVREVILYSSGRNAVLVGWSSQDGLPKLKKGRESQDRLKSSMKAFEQKLKAAFSDRIQFNWTPHNPDQNSSLVHPRSGLERSRDSKWMRALRDFADFLKNAKVSHSRLKRVKIAIIDDGIDTTLPELSDRIKNGESFYHLDPFAVHRGAYYVPSGAHGTLMARCICQVCPMADLYIGQLETLPGFDDRRSFTIESATEAIEWAVQQEVDIISMSWSIESKVEPDDFKRAIKMAADAKITMFCASIDAGPTVKDRSYPGKFPGPIKIGASTAVGSKLSWVSSDKEMFLVPGEIPNFVSHSSTANTPMQSTGGSSISTALASGLAGVLIYCERLLNITSSDLAEGQRGSGSYYLNGDHMKDVFSNLSVGERFIQIWEHLPHDDLKWDILTHPEKTKETRKRLEHFMDKIKEVGP